MNNYRKIIKYTVISLLSYFLFTLAGPIIYRALDRAGFLTSSIHFELGEYLISILLSLYLFWRLPSQIDPRPDRWNFWKGGLWIAALFLINFIIQPQISIFGSFLYDQLHLIQSHLGISRHASNELSNLSMSWYWATVVLLGPLLEELIYRGWLFAMWSRVLNAKSCILVTALLFAIGHLTNIITSTQYLIGYMLTIFPSIFFTGLLLGMIRTRFSIVHSIILHGLANAAVCWFQFYG